MKKKLRAMITVELAVSLVLIAAVLFVALGLFGNNLSTVVENSNFKNVFNKDDSKFFSNYGKDYASSQIVVQVMGEQGLSQLRRKANNKAIQLIENPFSNSNLNAVTIAYLSAVINSIVGDPSICVYMKKDSSAYCSDSSIGGYKYRIYPSGGNALTIYRTIQENGRDVAIAGNYITLPLKSDIISALSSQALTASTQAGGQNTNAAKYERIKNLTATMKEKGYADIALINLIEKFKSKKQNRVKIKAEIRDLLKDVSERLNSSWHSCSSEPAKLFDRKCKPARVQGKDVDKYEKWVIKINTKLDSEEGDAQAMLDIVVKDSELCSVIDSINDDGKRQSYETFIEGLQNIADKNDAVISISCQ